MLRLTETKHEVMRIGVMAAQQTLVERYVRDVEVACSNHVTPTFGKEP